MNGATTHRTDTNDGNAAAVVFVPGLTRTLVERGGLAHVRQWLGRTRQAGVVPSFPCLGAVVQASVLTGQPSPLHGVTGLLGTGRGVAAPSEADSLFARLRRECPARTSLALGLAVGAADPERGKANDSARAARLVGAWTGDRSLAFAAIVLEEWAQALVTSGGEHPGALATLAAVDQLLGGLFERRPPGCTLLVCGAPTFAPVRRGIPLDELAQRCGAVEFAGEGAVARLRIVESDRTRAKDALLETEGLERILDQDAPASWGFAPLDPDELLALAEPGWAFVAPGTPTPRACAGHPEANEIDEPLVLWAEDSAPTAWPKRVHDYRLGITLAHTLGLATDDFCDRPLPGVL